MGQRGIRIVVLCLQVGKDGRIIAVAEPVPVVDPLVPVLEEHMRPPGRDRWADGGRRGRGGDQELAASRGARGCSERRRRRSPGTAGPGETGGTGGTGGTRGARGTVGARWNRLRGIRDSGGSDSSAIG